MLCEGDDMCWRRSLDPAGVQMTSRMRGRNMTSRWYYLFTQHQGGGQWEWSDEGGAESVSWLGGGLGIDIHLGSGGVNSRM